MKIIANRQLIVLLTFLIVGTTVFSQQTKLGVKAGANIANWNVNQEGSSFNTTSLVGIEGGVFVELPVSKTFFIQPEVMYSQFGSKLTSGGDAIKYQLNYISIPVLAKYCLPNGFGVYAGPQLGLLLSANGKFDGDKEDIKSMLKSTDFFAVMGVEYNLPVGVTIAARYNHGIINIYALDEGKIHNSSFALSLAYKFAAPKAKASSK